MHKTGLEDELLGIRYYIVRDTWCLTLPNMPRGLWNTKAFFGENVSGYRCLNQCGLALYSEGPVHVLLGPWLLFPPLFITTWILHYSLFDLYPNSSFPGVPSEGCCLGVPSISNYPFLPLSGFREGFCTRDGKSESQEWQKTFPLAVK